jgi:hypothetical protein
MTLLVLHPLGSVPIRVKRSQSNPRSADLVAVFVEPQNQLRGGRHLVELYGRCRRTPRPRMASPRSTCSILVTSAPHLASSAESAGTHVCSVFQNGNVMHHRRRRPPPNGSDPRAGTEIVPDGVRHRGGWHCETVRLSAPVTPLGVPGISSRALEARREMEAHGRVAVREACRAVVR